ncbi:hypothetical protein EVAR_49473_1 [Eumeta japonica]|uniref:Uncharacterized protein n=1 Tax=Eumeta variegata TaxID=151549 RepID=A0A4C1Y4Z1_EUMVA|nr:hypothetical protein EVAR_49473_1 [Eumeta japonica]
MLKMQFASMVEVAHTGYLRQKDGVWLINNIRRRVQNTHSSRSCTVRDVGLGQCASVAPGLSPFAALTPTHFLFPTEGLRTYGWPVAGRELLNDVVTIVLTITRTWMQ